MKGGRRPGGLGVALGLALGPAVALGLARFAYTLLLPPMRTDLGWSYSAAGAMNTANAVGYLAGALIAAAAARHAGARRCFLAGLAVIVVALAATAATANLAVLLGLRALAGAAGAVCFIAGAGLVAQLSARSGPGRTALLLGVYFAGAGAGIVVSGLTIPALLAHVGAAGWRASWLALAGLATLALAATVPAARAAEEPPPRRPGRDRWPARRLAVLLATYGLFGAGYIAYLTFIVAFLGSEGATGGMISLFWVVLGTASIGAAFGWAPLLARLPGGIGPAVVLGVVTAGALIPLFGGGSAAAALVSAVLFGASFLTVVTAVTAMARRALRPRHWTPAIAALTVAFAVGQCAGPVLAGVLSDGPAGVRAGLLLSVVLLAAATLLALAQRERAPT